MRFYENSRQALYAATLTLSVIGLAGYSAVIHVEAEKELAESIRMAEQMQFDAQNMHVDFSEVVFAN